MNTRVFLLLLCFGSFISCQNHNRLIDPQGNEYLTVQVGEMIWLNENLNLETEDGSFCYDENSLECDTMGRLYTWEGAKKAAETIEGWHLPSKAEWKDLLDHFGGDSLAFQNILNAENSFKPQAAGVRLSNGKYAAKRFKGVNYWSSSVADTSSRHAYSIAFMDHLQKVSTHNYPIENACSVRLVKDR